MNRLFAKAFKIKKWLFNQKISRKITVIFLLFVICSIIMTHVLYTYVSEKYSASRMENLSHQTLVSVGSSVVEIVEAVNNNYNLLLKIGIENIIKFQMTPETQRVYDNFLFTLVDTYNNLDAIYITNLDNYIYGIDHAGNKSLVVSSLSQAPWYNDVLNAGGSYVLSYNAGNIFKSNYNSNFISIIRAVNDLSTQKPIGFAILNLPVDAINDLFKTVYPSDDNCVALFDGQNKLITSTNNLPDDFSIEKIVSNINSNSLYYSEVTNTNIEAGLLIPQYNWKLVSYMPRAVKSDVSGSLITISVLVLIVNASLMFLGSIFITKSISSPINRLISAMKGIKNGQFKPVEINYNNSNNEIGILQENYNLMIHEIQSLISRLMNEQKIKRKAELSVLQEQIKPHFLYNTLDAIGYMALTENPQSVYDAIETLGSFYRLSLSSGSQVISIKQEIQIVKDYVRLLTLRYESLFTISYDIDENALSYNVVKLIIQPLIENSVYHGIKPMGGEGHINFSVNKLEDSIRFIIEDNGVGMDEDTIQSIFSSKMKRTGSGFGLVGTMERIDISYGAKSSFDIESKKNEGTKITIKIPLESLVE